MTLDDHRRSVLGSRNRVFPAFRPFAAAVMKGVDRTIAFGPYVGEELTYKSKTMVEYRTPAQTEGLGTRSLLKKNDSPIDGVAILIVGEDPDSLLLSASSPQSDRTDARDRSSGGARRR